MPNSECITAVQRRRRRPSWSLIEINRRGQAIKRGFFRIVSHSVAGESDGTLGPERLGPLIPK
eukprot:scaffold22564_cov101-Skeletonema_marinoi.AAC.1